MQIARTEAFKKDFLRLPGNVRKAAAKQIVQLLIDHTHPSLHVEAIAGRPGLFSARVDRRYRMSLEPARCSGRHFGALTREADRGLSVMYHAEDEDTD